MNPKEELKGALEQIKQWAIECKRLQPGSHGKYKSEADRMNSLKLLMHIHEQAEAAMFALEHVRCYRKREGAENGKVEKEYSSEESKTEEVV